MKTNSDSILDILGNDTRRKILSTLADEPMYFNQLSKEIDIGQQAILRHLDSLEKAGLVETYSEKSEFGAPSRKYYRLSSAFTLTISLSEDDFLVSHQKIKDSLSTHSKKKVKKPEESASEETGATVSLLYETLNDVNGGIAKMESHLSTLRARRQDILRRLHEIGTERFEGDERKVLYVLVRESPKSFAELSDLLDEKESVLKALLASMRGKMEGQSDWFDLFDNL